MFPSNLIILFLVLLVLVVLTYSRPKKTKMLELTEEIKDAGL